MTQPVRRRCVGHANRRTDFLPRWADPVRAQVMARRRTRVQDRQNARLFRPLISALVERQSATSKGHVAQIGQAVLVAATWEGGGRRRSVHYAAPTGVPGHRSLTNEGRLSLYGA